MSFIKKKKHELIVACAFLFWCIACWPFLGGDRQLVEDAVSYYQHIGFFTEHLGRGVYPLWDPQWVYGAPYTFFLRRIGEVNPFYLFITFMHKAGIHHFYAYRIFLALYYLLACIGIYRIAWMLSKDKLNACISFVLMLFSCFSFHLFNDYIVILLTPLVWFFVFLINFYQNQRKSAYIGLTFVTMIILTTYIPFLIMSILLSFAAIVFIVSPGTFWNFWKKLWGFIKNNKVLSCLGLLLVLYSFTPGLELYLQSKGEEARFALPGRNNGVETDSVFGYGKSLIKGGDIITHGRFENMLGSYNHIVLDDIYYPVWGLIIFCIGFFTRIHRRQIILILLFFFLMLFAMTTTTPLYAFLDKHIFFIKFFRQLHYFFWIACIPIVTLVLADQACQILHWRTNSRWKSCLINVFIFIVHAAWFVLLINQESWLLSQQIMVILSCVILLGVVNEWHHVFRNKTILLTVIILIIAMPSFYVYRLAAENTVSVENIDQTYQSYKLDFHFQEYEKENVTPDIDIYLDYLRRRTDLHYASAAFAFIKEQLPGSILENYLKNKVMIYDNIQYITFNQQVINGIAGAFSKNLNVAFVYDPEQEGEFKALSSITPQHPTIATGNTSEVNLLHFDLNEVIFQTDFDRSRILVYNDSYDKNWRVYIDGKEKPLLHTNLAFKGVVVPEGKHKVRFRIGSPQEYFWRISVVLACWFALGMVIYYMIKENRLVRRKK